MICVAQEKTAKVFLKAKVVMSKEVITIDENASVKEAVDITGVVGTFDPEDGRDGC